jgi:hypothetical protein
MAAGGGFIAAMGRAGSPVGVAMTSWGRACAATRVEGAAASERRRSSYRDNASVRANAPTASAYMSIRFFTNAPNEEGASVADEHDNLMRKRPYARGKRATPTPTSPSSILPPHPIDTPPVVPPSPRCNQGMRTAAK